MTATFKRLLNAVAAGLCGSLAHTALMAFKNWAGILPAFTPYDDLQAALTRMAGTSVPPLVVWALTYFNGSVVLSFLFGRLVRYLPAESGAGKGAVFGLGVWLAMGVAFFPAIGKGLFAAQTSLGFAPTAFSLAMVLTYSVTLGVTYAVFTAEPRAKPDVR